MIFYDDGGGDGGKTEAWVDVFCVFLLRFGRFFVFVFLLSTFLSY